ncbi:MAG: Nif3-like dinuclear metal center hexameric protein [Clostridia bacterium]|nr:Nif3-like dinuclear metal center hexameric protein [Clostridia bacterium]
MAKIKDILSLIRKIAPEDKTDPDFSDNVGLLVGSEEGETKDVLCCLDCTPKVIRQASAIGAKLILSHHPIIFRSVQSVTDKDLTGRTIIEALKSGISIYSAHTNLDFCDGGINDFVANRLCLDCIEPMKTSDGVKIGRIGELKEPVSLKKLGQMAAKAFDDDFVFISGDEDRIIKRVAVINGGAGDADYVHDAIALWADCYVSGDFRHHVLLNALENGISILGISHGLSERKYIPELCSILNRLSKTDGIDANFIAAKEIILQRGVK